MSYDDIAVPFFIDNVLLNAEVAVAGMAPGCKRPPRTCAAAPAPRPTWLLLEDARPRHHHTFIHNLFDDGRHHRFTRTAKRHTVELLLSLFTTASPTRCPARGVRARYRGQFCRWVNINRTPRNRFSCVQEILPVRGGPDLQPR